MSEPVRNATIRRLSELYAHQKQPISVVLHGGEPLLIGTNRLRELCRRLRNVLPPPCEIHVQTNGILVSDDVIDIFIRYNVGVSISIDGTSDVHNRFRVDHAGRGSHRRVLNAINRLTTRMDARPLFAGVLAVVDPTSDPDTVYTALKATRAPSIDFLVRDGNHDRLPFMKASVNSTEYGNWMVRLLDIYLSDPEPPRVRIFDDMLRLILGGRAQKEGVGKTDYGILVIDTDGGVSKNDTLKVAYNAADQFEAESWSILSDSLVDIVHSQTYANYYQQQRPTASACRACHEYNVCGGGMVAHRWSDDRGFDNPSIFCADQLLLIRRMRERVAQCAVAGIIEGAIDGQHS